MPQCRRCGHTPTALPSPRQTTNLRPVPATRPQRSVVRQPQNHLARTSPNPPQPSTHVLVSVVTALMLMCMLGIMFQIFFSLFK